MSVGYPGPPDGSRPPRRPTPGDRALRGMAAEPARRATERTLLPGELAPLRPPVPAVLPLVSSGLSDQGRQRKTNQDRFTTQTFATPTGEVTLLAVADGMGGAAGGETASQGAIQTLLETLSRAPLDSAPAEALAEAIGAANRAVFEHAQVQPDLRGMGTTIVAALVKGGQAIVAHVGDSRAYLVRNGVAQRLTADHSWVAEQVRIGDLTEEEAARSERRNVLLRSVGVSPNVTAEVSDVLMLAPADMLVLCSDGLHGVVDDATIAATVRDLDPATAVRRLVDLANERGGPDNVTAVAARLGPAGASAFTASLPAVPPMAAAHRLSRSRQLAVLAAAIVFLAVGGLVFTFTRGSSLRSSSPPSAASATPAVRTAATAVASPTETPTPTTTAATSGGSAPTASMEAPRGTPQSSSTILSTPVSSQALTPALATPMASTGLTSTPRPYPTASAEFMAWLRDQTLQPCTPDEPLTDDNGPCTTKLPDGSPPSIIEQEFSVSHECLARANELPGDNLVHDRAAGGFWPGTYRLLSPNQCAILMSGAGPSPAPLLDQPVSASPTVRATVRASSTATPSPSPSPSPNPSSSSSHR